MLGNSRDDPMYDLIHGNQPAVAFSVLHDSLLECAFDALVESLWYLLIEAHSATIKSLLTCIVLVVGICSPGAVYCTHFMVVVLLLSWLQKMRIVQIK